MDQQNERWLVRMSKWTHPQGLAALVVGVYAALCPIWTTHPTGKAMYTMITLGVITAALALVSLAIPGRIAFEGLVALMGVLFILSPFVMSFRTGYTAFAWTAWIVGAVALLAGLWDVQVTRSLERSGGVVTTH
jgi:SPW repeat